MVENKKMRKMSIPEILNSTEGKSKEEKVEILRNNSTRALRHILYTAFSKNLEFNLPKTRPENLKEVDQPTGLSYNSLYKQSRKLRIFIKNNGYDNVSEDKRKQILLEMLESVDNEERELLLQILFDRKLKISLEYEVVKEAFPELILDLKEPVKEVKEESAVYESISEVYEKNKSKKKTKTKKKSSKKKSK
tara:strand:- start:232 stop:807 length:576 start_codon:yes stop_codon:yes gene_type:complete